MALKIVVDRGRCTGMGVCESLAPDRFEIGDDGVMMLHRADFTDAERDLLDEIVRSCPARALSVEEG